MNRRTFIKASAALLAAGVINPVEAGVQESSAAWTKPRSIKKAIMFNTVPGDLPVLERFKLAKKAGFAGIEPNSSMDQKRSSKHGAKTEMGAA